MIVKMPPQVMFNPGRRLIIRVGKNFVLHATYHKPKSKTAKSRYDFMLKPVSRVFSESRMMHSKHSVHVSFEHV